MTRRAQNGFSLIEMLVVLGLILILLGFMLPSLSRSRRLAAAVRCRNQLRQIGVVVSQYANENGGHVFPVDRTKGTKPRAWPEMLFSEPSPAVVRCPTADGESVSYQMNNHLIGNGLKYAKRSTRPPSEIVVAGESWPGMDILMSGHPPDETKTTSWDPARHGPGLDSNYLWWDFHVSNDAPHSPSRPNEPWQPS